MEETSNMTSVLSVSVIDYIGRLENGVALLLSVMIFDELYEVAYWFNKEGAHTMMPDNRMLSKLGVSDIDDYEYSEDLEFLIYTNIPKKDEILAKFTTE